MGLASYQTAPPCKSVGAGVGIEPTIAPFEAELMRLVGVPWPVPALVLAKKRVAFRPQTNLSRLPGASQQGLQAPGIG